MKSHVRSAVSVSAASGVKGRNPASPSVRVIERKREVPIPSHPPGSPYRWGRPPRLREEGQPLESHGQFHAQSPGERAPALHHAIERSQLAHSPSFLTQEDVPPGPGPRVFRAVWRSKYPSPAPGPPSRSLAGPSSAQLCLGKNSILDNSFSKNLQ